MYNRDVALPFDTMIKLEGYMIVKSTYVHEIVRQK